MVALLIFLAWHTLLTLRFLPGRCRLLAVEPFRVLLLLLFLLFLLFLPAPHTALLPPHPLQTPHPPQPPAPQIPSGGCCSCLRRIALCCPRIPCRLRILRILLSPRPRRSLREVAVHGGAADSSGAAALVSIAVRLGRGSWNFCKFRKPFCSR